MYVNELIHFLVHLHNVSSPLQDFRILTSPTQVTHFGLVNKLTDANSYIAIRVVDVSQS